MSEQQVLDESQRQMPNGAKKKSKPIRRRGRSITVQITLSGDVAKWAKQEADSNFRTIEGQIAYCVKGTMDGAKD